MARFTAYRLILGVVLLGMLPSLLFACRCSPKGSPKEALNRADFVFIGTATSVDSRILKEVKGLAWYALAEAKHWVGGPDPDLIEEPGGLREIQARFKIRTLFKGELGEEAIVRTGLNIAICGYSFSRGKEYLVYGYESSGKLHTSICTRTKLVERAFEEVDVLRKHEGPLETNVPQVNQRQPPQ